jgi:D-alanyl-D-alanine dipeptidase
MPRSFVYLRDVDPTILQDMRYAGSHNFMGRKAPGYEAPECVLVRQAAQALKAVQTELREQGLTLKVYDCYRPVRAVRSFVSWAKLPDDPKSKSTYYPTFAKRSLFPGYVATISSHSRGGTVDLTIVALGIGAELEAAPPAESSVPGEAAPAINAATSAEAASSQGSPAPAEAKAPDQAMPSANTTVASAATPTSGGATPAAAVPTLSVTPCSAALGKRPPDNSIDMGTSFDCFDVKANTHVSGLTAEQRQNRATLLGAMGRHGFRNYAKEWWHYTLVNEPYPDTVFDFPITTP